VRGHSPSALNSQRHHSAYPCEVANLPCFASA
jgi:hypothetical protein